MICPKGDPREGREESERALPLALSATGGGAGALNQPQLCRALWASWASRGPWLCPPAHPQPPPRAENPGYGRDSVPLPPPETSSSCRVFRVGDELPTSWSSWSPGQKSWEGRSRGSGTKPAWRQRDGVSRTYSVWLPREGCHSSQESHYAENACGSPLTWLRCPQGETSQAPLDCSQNPSYHGAPLSFLLAHQLHLLAAQGRPKRLAKGTA